MRSGMVRVVLDTNVLVSALLVPGSPPAKILELILAGNLRLIISPGIITELASVVTYPKLKKSLRKHGVSDEEVAHALHTLLKIATITPGARNRPWYGWRPERRYGALVCPRGPG
jgi:putative PIN family toxin of toxin-antitoxin system